MAAPCLLFHWALSSFSHPVSAHCPGLPPHHLPQTPTPLDLGPGLHIVFVPLSHALTINLDASEYHS